MVKYSNSHIFNSTPLDFWLKWCEGYAAMFYLMPLENQPVGDKKTPCAFEQWDGIERRCGEAVRK